MSDKTVKTPAGDPHLDLKIGEQWTNVYNGCVYRWNGKVWKWTGETVPVPFLGEFP